MAAIELVVFDMDGVLCHYDFARRLACLAEKTGLDPDVIDEEVFRSGFDDRGDQGQFSAVEYLEEFNKRLGVHLSREDWLWARGQSITPDTDMLALVARLLVEVQVLQALDLRYPFVVSASLHSSDLYQLRCHPY